MNKYNYIVEICGRDNDQQTWTWTNVNSSLDKNLQSVPFFLKSHLVTSFILPVSKYLIPNT